MGWYLHAVPTDGGLFVPAKNLLDLIEDINELYKDEPQVHLNLNPRNPVEAMENTTRAQLLHPPERTNPRGDAHRVGNQR